MRRTPAPDASPALSEFEARLSPAERQQLDDLKTPDRLQSFLDTLPYSDDPFYRCPLRSLRERKAHCFDGALLAAAILRRNDYPPLLLELLPNARDDDHLLALFQQDGCWGAVAQSNFTGLRFREPVYRSLRELAMSYFEDFFNSAGERTLVGYRGPIRLATFDRLDWMGSDSGLEALSDGMDRYRVRRLIPESAAARLGRVSERSLRAGLLGSNPKGLYKL
jgi:hypothetical protein